MGFLAGVAVGVVWFVCLVVVVGLIGCAIMDYKAKKPLWKLSRAELAQRLEADPTNADLREVAIARVTFQLYHEREEEAVARAIALLKGGGR